eukprot:657186-Hanusia_phi.AAC.1
MKRRAEQANAVESRQSEDEPMVSEEQSLNHLSAPAAEILKEANILECIKRDDAEALKLAVEQSSVDVDALLPGYDHRTMLHICCAKN